MAKKPVTIQRVVILARDWPESSAMDGKRLSVCPKVTVHGTGSRHPCRDDGASEQLQKPEPFWKTLSLVEMSRKQWESLCDGCAKCCLQKLEDEDTREIHFTNIVCDLLDLANCRCTHYAERSVRVPSCVTLTPVDLQDPYWLPETCAYRLLAEGQDLPPWHPLVSGSDETVISSGNSIRGRVIRESDADAWEYHLIDWV
jgi:uncharacterized cysteine cluster protein YcgN (CxxCxxCC family)